MIDAVSDVAAPVAGAAGGLLGSGGGFLAYLVANKMGFFSKNGSKPLTEDRVKIMIMESKDEIMGKLEDNRKEIMIEIRGLK